MMKLPFWSYHDTEISRYSKLMTDGSPILFTAQPVQIPMTDRFDLILQAEFRRKDRGEYEGDTSEMVYLRGTLERQLNVFGSKTDRYEFHVFICTCFNARGEEYDLNASNIRYGDNTYNRILIAMTEFLINIGVMKITIGIPYVAIRSYDYGDGLIEDERTIDVSAWYDTLVYSVGYKHITSNTNPSSTFALFEMDEKKWAAGSSLRNERFKHF